MDIFSTAQQEEALPSGWKEVKRYMYYMFHVFFFVLLVLTTVVSIFVVATFSLVPSMQRVTAENITINEQPEKLRGQDHRL